MRSFLMILVALTAAPGCRTVDDAAQAKAAATGVPKVDPAAVAFVAGPSAQALYDSLEAPEKTEHGMGTKTYAGGLVVACSRSGKDVFFCAMNPKGSNIFLFSLDKEAALEFYNSFRIAERTMGHVSTKTYEGQGAVRCQYTAVGDVRQGFYCDLTGEGFVPGPVAELKGADAQALYQALKLPETASVKGKQKEKAATASVYIRCVKSDDAKYHCMVKTGQASLAVVKGDAAAALYESLRAPEDVRGGKRVKEFQGQAKIECRTESCEVGYAQLQSPASRKNP